MKVKISYLYRTLENLDMNGVYIKEKSTFDAPTAEYLPKIQMGKEGIARTALM